MGEHNTHIKARQSVTFIIKTPLAALTSWAVTFRVLFQQWAPLTASTSFKTPAVFCHRGRFFALTIYSIATLPRCRGQRRVSHLSSSPAVDCTPVGHCASFAPSPLLLGTSPTPQANLTHLVVVGNGRFAQLAFEIQLEGEIQIALQGRRRR